ncbi:MAG: flagellar hook-length control protein FliK [Nitrospirae bacterium]|nr:MAG: flagellar hook-length control protein FliK [Nitrospirota bacterium]
MITSALLDSPNLSTHPSVLAVLDKQEPTGKEGPSTGAGQPIPQFAAILAETGARQSSGPKGEASEYREPPAESEAVGGDGKGEQGLQRGDDALSGQGSLEGSGPEAAGEGSTTLSANMSDMQGSSVQDRLAPSVSALPSGKDNGLPLLAESDHLALTAKLDMPATNRGARDSSHHALSLQPITPVDDKESGPLSNVEAARILLRASPPDLPLTQRIPLPMPIARGSLPSISSQLIANPVSLSLSEDEREAGVVPARNAMAGLPNFNVSSLDGMRVWQGTLGSSSEPPSTSSDSIGGLLLDQFAASHDQSSPDQQPPFYQGKSHFIPGLVMSGGSTEGGAFSPSIAGSGETGPALNGVGDRGGIMMSPQAPQRLHMDVILPDASRVQIEVMVQQRQVSTHLIMEHVALRNLALQHEPVLDAQLSSVGLELKQLGAHVADQQGASHEQFSSLGSWERDAADRSHRSDHTQSHDDSVHPADVSELISRPELLRETGFHYVA